MNIFNIILGIIVSWLLAFIIKNNVNLNFNDVSLRFNLIATDSVIVGFLYAALGILLTGLEKPRVKRLDKHYYLDDYFNGLYISIILLIVSIVLSLMIAIGALKNRLFYQLELWSMLSGILFFLKVVFSSIELMNKIRKD